MQPIALLAAYCGLVVVASLAGGFVPLLLKLTHRRMQIAISFVSGVILGIGLLHLLPHGYLALGSIDAAVGWVLVGFLFMFFLERFFHFHHHDTPDEVHADVHRHEDHAHDHAHPPHAPAAEHHGHRASASFSWLGATIGLSLHGLVDGVAMAAAVQAGLAEGDLRWAGLGTALAVALHKPFDALTIGTLLAAAGKSVESRRLFNFGYALITPLGVLLCYLLTSTVTDAEHGLGEMLCFAAGAFICIATSDLLPELQFHRHDRVALSIALLLGIALAWSTILLEGEHAHSHALESHSHEHDEQQH